MSDDELNHYEVVGVDPTASKDAIRQAYRARLDDLLGGDTMSDEDRAETARLNAAWQVLSDPYQRERYDHSMGIEPGSETEGGDGGEVIDVEATESDGGRGRARPAGRQPPGDRVGMFSAEPQPAPATWPPGLRPPPPRARIIAMVIDLVVLIAIALAVQTAGARIIDSVYEEETDRLDRIGDQIDDLEEQRDRAEDRADDAEPGPERRQALDDAEEAEDAIEVLEDEEQDLQSDLAPATLMVTGAILVLALLYLVPSSVLTGRTFGKHLLGIRVVNTDGSRLRLRGALLHYGAPVLFALILSPLLGQLVVLIVLIGVLTWPRNPNRQGLHDRLANTLVVDG